MAVTEQVKKQHLLWRAGFGPGTQLNGAAAGSPFHLYDSLVKSSSDKPIYLDVATALDDRFFGDMSEKENVFNVQETKQRVISFAKESREYLKKLNLQWLDQMVESPAQLTEKISLFWHGHFACRSQNVFHQQMLLHSIRSNALGNFRTLLTEVSKSPAMLAFLNNQQNRKSQPNENFAREVMELFTIGRGNYTEKDVKEAARAFTGWGFNLKTGFVFRKFQHDTGSKTLMGRTGNFDGDDVIKILLEQKNTAQFIARKVYSYFVNEQVDEAKVHWLAERFYQSDYEIGSLMKDIFTSSWFYDERNIGAKIKSPVELLVGIRRILPMELKRDEVQLLLQRALGQVLFYPPNVAGWPGGKNWIDSSSLMLRLKIPQFLNGEPLAIATKIDDDQEMGMSGAASNKNKNGFADGMNRFKLNAVIDWPQYIKLFNAVSRPQLNQAIAGLILQTPKGSISSDVVNMAADASSRENYIKSVSIALMSTPDYQMC